jgi:hypothetical protein
MIERFERKRRAGRDYNRPRWMQFLPTWREVRNLRFLFPSEHELQALKRMFSGASKQK